MRRQVAVEKRGCAGAATETPGCSSRSLRQAWVSSQAEIVIGSKTEKRAPTLADMNPLGGLHASPDPQEAKAFSLRQFLIEPVHEKLSPATIYG
jgi:hypothetical protein